MLLVPMGLLATRISRGTLNALYLLPLIVLLGLGREWLFLLVVPVIWLLVNISAFADSPTLVVEPAQ